MPADLAADGSNLARGVDLLLRCGRLQAGGRRQGRWKSVFCEVDRELVLSYVMFFMTVVLLPGAHILPHRVRLNILLRFRNHKPQHPYTIAGTRTPNSQTTVRCSQGGARGYREYTHRRCTEL